MLRSQFQNFSLVQIAFKYIDSLIISFYMTKIKFLLITILSTLLVHTHEQIILFDTHAIQKIFQGRTPTLFLFASDNDESNQIRKIFAQLDKQGVDSLLSISDLNDGFGMYERLTDYLGIDPDITPQLLFLGQHQEKFFYPQQKITKQGLKQFIRQALAGQIEPFVKSSIAPQKNEGYVKIAVGSTYKKMIIKSDKQFLVMFHAPWCAHCKNMAHDYQQAARKLHNNENIVLVKIDGTENEVPGIQIQGFPTLKFYPKDKSKGPIQYTGGRTTDEIIDWLKRHVHYPWVEPAYEHRQQEKAAESKQKQKQKQKQETVNEENTQL